MGDSNEGANDPLCDELAELWTVKTIRCILRRWSRKVEKRSPLTAALSLVLSDWDATVGERCRLCQAVLSTLTSLPVAIGNYAVRKSNRAAHSVGVKRDVNGQRSSDGIIWHPTRGESCASLRSALLSLWRERGLGRKVNMQALLPASLTAPFSLDIHRGRMWTNQGVICATLRRAATYVALVRWRKAVVFTKSSSFLQQKRCEKLQSLVYRQWVQITRNVKASVCCLRGFQDRQKRRRRWAAFQAWRSHLQQRLLRQARIEAYLADGIMRRGLQKFKAAVSRKRKDAITAQVGELYSTKRLLTTAFSAWRRALWFVTSATAYDRRRAVKGLFQSLAKWKYATQTSLQRTQRLERLQKSRKRYAIRQWVRSTESRRERIKWRRAGAAVYKLRGLNHFRMQVKMKVKHRLLVKICSETRRSLLAANALRLWKQRLGGRQLGQRLASHVYRATLEPTFRILRDLTAEETAIAMSVAAQRLKKSVEDWHNTASFLRYIRWSRDQLTVKRICIALFEWRRNVQMRLERHQISTVRRLSLLRTRQRQLLNTWRAALMTKFLHRYWSLKQAQSLAADGLMAWRRFASHRTALRIATLSNCRLILKHALRQWRESSSVQRLKAHLCVFQKRLRLAHWFIRLREARHISFCFELIQRRSEQRSLRQGLHCLKRHGEIDAQIESTFEPLLVQASLVRARRVLKKWCLYTDTVVAGMCLSEAVAWRIKSRVFSAWQHTSAMAVKDSLMLEGIAAWTLVQKKRLAVNKWFKTGAMRKLARHVQRECARKKQRDSFEIWYGETRQRMGFKDRLAAALSRASSATPVHEESTRKREALKPPPEGPGRSLMRQLNTFSIAADRFSFRRAVACCEAKWRDAARSARLLRHARDRGMARIRAKICIKMWQLQSQQTLRMGTRIASQVRMKKVQAVWDLWRGEAQYQLLFLQQLRAFRVRRDFAKWRKLAVAFRNSRQRVVQQRKTGAVKEWIDLLAVQFQGVEFAQKLSDRRHRLRPVWQHWRRKIRRRVGATLIFAQLCTIQQVPLHEWRLRLRLELWRQCVLGRAVREYWQIAAQHRAACARAHSIIANSTRRKGELSEAFCNWRGALRRVLTVRQLRSESRLQRLWERWATKTAERDRQWSDLFEEALNLQVGKLVREALATWREVSRISVAHRNWINQKRQACLRKWLERAQRRMTHQREIRLSQKRSALYAFGVALRIQQHHTLLRVRIIRAATRIWTLRVQRLRQQRRVLFENEKRLRCMIETNRLLDVFNTWKAKTPVVSDEGLLSVRVVGPPSTITGRLLQSTTDRMLSISPKPTLPIEYPSGSTEDRAASGKNRCENENSCGVKELSHSMDTALLALATWQALRLMRLNARATSVLEGRQLDLVKAAVREWRLTIKEKNTHTQQENRAPSNNRGNVSGRQLHQPTTTVHFWPSESTPSSPRSKVSFFRIV